MNTDLDTVLDRVQSILNQLGEIVDDIRDDTEAPDPDPEPWPVWALNPGGWMQVPGRQRWRKIKAVTRCEAAGDCHRIDFEGPATDRDGTFIHMYGYERVPYRTSVQFDRDCDTEGNTP